ALVGCGVPSVALPADMAIQPVPSSSAAMSAGQAPQSNSQAPASVSPSYNAPASPNSTSVGPCYDGDCEIALSGPMSFPVDPRFGFDTVSVWMNSKMVTVMATGPGVTSKATAGPGSTARINGLRMHVLRVSGATAALRFSA